MPWIMWLRSRFILLIVERKWDSKSLSGNLWSQELRVSFPCNFRIIYLIKPLTAEIWSYVTLRLRCMKKDLLRKESAIKNCHKFSSKKFQVYKKDRSQLRSIHSVCFWKSIGQKGFLVCDTCITVPGQTKYCRAKRLCLTKHHYAAFFLANKPLRELGIRKKRKIFCTQGTIRENAELSPARQSTAGNHRVHSKYDLW